MNRELATIRLKHRRVHLEDKIAPSRATACPPKSVESFFRKISYAPPRWSVCLHPAYQMTFHFSPVILENARLYRRFFSILSGRCNLRS